MPGSASLSSVCPVRTEDSQGSRSSSVLRTRHRRRRRDPSSCPAAQTAPSTRTLRRQEPRRAEGDSWLCCPDSDEHTTVRGGEISGYGFSADTEMKAAGKQVTVTADKLNGDMKRRPSYPGELRAKHANMSTKIWVKVAMAIVYFLCVSVAAFILVIYYVFFWTPDQSHNSTSTEAFNRTECAPLSG